MGYFVMPGLVPGIHGSLQHCPQAWMAGTSPAMTLKKRLILWDSRTGQSWAKTGNDNPLVVT
jgi:hypothetical protein